MPVISVCPGRRGIEAAHSDGGCEVAIPLYNAFLEQLESDLGKSVQRRQFGADMKVGLVNAGPETITSGTRARQ